MHFLFYRMSFSFLRTCFSCFLFFGQMILSRNVLGKKSLSRDVCSCPCPGTKGHGTRIFFLSRNKGTMSRPVEMLVWIGLTDLPKSGGGVAPFGPPALTALLKGCAVPKMPHILVHLLDITFPHNQRKGKGKCNCNSLWSLLQGHWVEGLNYS